MPEYRFLFKLNSRWQLDPDNLVNERLSDRIKNQVIEELRFLAYPYEYWSNRKQQGNAYKIRF